MAKGIIGIPCRLEGRTTLFHESVEELVRPDDVDVIYRRNNSVAQARNEIIVEGLHRGAEWFWFLDDDLIFKPDTLMRVLQRPESIVIGLSMGRRPVTGTELPQFWPLWSSVTHLGSKWKPVDDIVTESNGLMRLTSGTAGGVLIRSAVFRRIDPPWFAIGQYVPDMFWEDIYFYEKCRAAGFQIWGDPTIHFGHDSSVTFWPYQNAEGRWFTMIARGYEPMVGMEWPTPVNKEAVA